MRIGDIFKVKAARSSLMIFIFIVIFSISFSYQAFAKVTGVCYNCHTMHNSQNGGNVLRTGSGVGWNTSDELSGGSLQGTPAENLLVTNCVGCHSSSTSDTTITVGGSTIPIVYNSSVPTFPLAGGNFYWVAQGDDTKGHNVYGIANTDDNLSTAPGRNPAGCSDSCHDSLADAPSGNNYNRGGCQGCHVFTYHHNDNGVYRFLKGHGQSPPITLTSSRKDITTYTDYVMGEEDSDWEYTTDNSGDHNYYKGTDDVYINAGSGLTQKNTITSFCSGCHRTFHGPKTNGDGMGSSGAWIRHPTDILLPDSGEYGDYDPDVNAKYSVEAPVAWKNPGTPVRSEAVVMCLSCHRPHGSDQPDMLRWDYSGMTVGTIAGAGKGCFTCHRNKDGA